MKELMDCKAFKQYLRFLKDNKMYSHTILINGTETKRYISEIRYKDYKEKGYNRYSKAYMQVARKNGKSMLLGYIGLFKATIACRQ